MRFRIPISRLMDGCKLQPVQRRGATIIEVMFAIGVLLFGLLGIAAFIPAASRLARSSIDFNRGASIGQSVAQEFHARGFGDTNRWVQIWDQNPNASTRVVPWNPATQTPAAVSIDPLFVSRPENFVQAGVVFGINTGAYNQVASSSNYFRRNQFPYYFDTYNPLVDPRNEVSFYPWPSSPRLARVAISSAAGAGIPSAMSSSRIVDDTDQPAFETPLDKTLPVSQVLRNGAAAPSTADFPIPAMRSNDPDYSWLATIQPQSRSLGTLSVAVIRGRDRTFETPNDGTAAVSVPGKPLELSERLAYVSAVVSNFSGGAGGSITLTCTDAVSSHLETDGWVMLIKNQTLGSRHAWYRIVNADREPIFQNDYVDDFTGDQRAVWHRNVTLDGPDWEFFGTSPGVSDDTFAVLVDGVISVTEATVKLQ